MMGAFPLCLFIKGATGETMPFYEDIIGNFMVYQDRTETYLLQLFAHRETSDWFSIILALFLRSTSLLNRNKHNW